MGESDKKEVGQMRLYIAPVISNVVDKKVDVDTDTSMGKSEQLEPKGPIPDEAILSDHEVKNDAILYVTFATGDDTWEDIADIIVKP